MSYWFELLNIRFHFCLHPECGYFYACNITYQASSMSALLSEWLQAPVIIWQQINWNLDVLKWEINGKYGDKNKHNMKHD